MRTVDQDRLNVKISYDILAVSPCMGQRTKSNISEPATEKVWAFTGGI